MRRGVKREAPAVLWALALALLILGPALGPGYLLVRDMVWVPDLALRPDFLGLGSGLPRAVPSDAVVAVLDEVVPGMVLQKVVLVAALAGGGIGVTRLLDRGGDPASLVVRLVAVTVYGWNAYVAERLLMGQWPVLVGYAALPWLLAAARRWRLEGRLPASLLALVPLGCLSASAGLATGVALLAMAAGGGRTLRVLALAVVGNAPWLVSGLLHASSATSDASAAEVFALRGEGLVPGPLAALTLGGIWNTEVMPESRTGVLGWVALVALVGLAAVGARSWWRSAAPRDRTALLVCWAVGWGVAVLTWAAPWLVGWSAAHVPGAGVVRDGARMLVLCAPLLAVLVAEGVRTFARRAPAERAARVALAAGVVLVPVAVLPDLALGAAGQLEPADYPAAYGSARREVAAMSERDPARGDVLVLPASIYRAPSWNHDRLVLDPVGRFLTPDYVTSDVLVVDGVPLEGEDPRFEEVIDALTEPSPATRETALARLGIGFVVTDLVAPGPAPEVGGTVLQPGPELRVVALDDVDRRHVPIGWMVAMAAAWAGFLGLVLAALVAGLVRVVRSQPRPTRDSGL